MKTDLCDMFGIEFPIFAFSHCRDVVAAVTNAGGMGVLGALAFTPDELRQELDWIDRHVDGKPYGVDVVMPAKTEAGTAPNDDQLLPSLQAKIPEEHKRFVEQVLEDYNVPPLPEKNESGGLLGWTDATARPQVDISLEHPISLLVNALGPPPKDVVDRAHEHDVKVAALVGRADQAVKQVEQGVDIIVAQGYEAGGHTGEIGSMVLLPEVVDAVSPTPVLGAGGIGSGRQMAAAMAMGAQGVWTGSIWLTVSEASTSPVIQKKLLDATSRDTVRSRVISGKPARQLRTKWTDLWEREDTPDPLPMPLQGMLVGEATSRISRAGVEDLMGSPVGQIVGQMNRVRSTREVVHGLVEEYLEAVSGLAEQLGEG